MQETIVAAKVLSYERRMHLSLLGLNLKLPKPREFNTYQFGLLLGEIERGHRGDRQKANKHPI